MANIGNIDSIKITQLTSIGANIAANTLIPVVNMANLSNPITQKSTLQNAANYILNNAGTATFPPALQSNLALSVANAAQPNITSVGTLQSLTVAGNTVLPDVSLVKIQGGNNGQFLQTNGNGVLDWAIPPSGNVTNYPGGANTQIQFNTSGTFAGSDAFTFDGNNVAITGANFIANPGAYIL